MISVEGDNSIIRQLNNCLSCLLRGFKCQDVLVRITDEYLMLYSFPLGGFSSCFQFNFDGRQFDRFETGEIVEFERIYKVSSLLNCFNNVQWFKATRFMFEIGGNEDDALNVTVHGKNGVVRRHRVYPVIGHQDRILLHERITWKRRHGIRMSSGLLKDIFGYMEIKESKMTLSISSQDSLISIKVQPIGSFGYDIPATSSSMGAGGSCGSNTSNNSTYQDIQIKKEQIETLSLCESIIENSSFTFNSREFKVAIALAENCQLPVFLTLRAPGSPMIVSIGQRAIIDQMCISDLDGNAIPFEYYWEKPLFQPQLFEIDNEYIEKTQMVAGFSAIFLLSTMISPDSAGPDPIASFNSPNENQEDCPDRDLGQAQVLTQVSDCCLSMVVSQETKPHIPSPTPPAKPDSKRGTGPETRVSNCSFSRLDRFDLHQLFQKFGVELEKSAGHPDCSKDPPEIKIPPKDQGVKSFDWIASLVW